MLPELTLRGGSLLLSAGMAAHYLLHLLHPSTSTLMPPGHGALELSGRLTGSKLSGPITGSPSKELLPIVLASIVWRRAWSSKHVRCHSDNSAVVQAINIRTVKDHNLMRLLRCLFFVEAQFNFRITAAHINGSINTAADMLSRNNIANFISSFPQVSPIPTSSSTGHTTGHQCRLAIPPLVKSAERYFAKSLSTASQRSYAAGTKRYLDFCSSFSLSPFPFSEVNLSSFVSFLADQGLKHQTLKCYLSAVRSAQIAHGYAEPNFSSFPRLVKWDKKGTGRVHLAKGSP